MARRQQSKGAFSQLKNVITNFGFLRRLRAHDTAENKFNNVVDNSKFTNQKELIAPPESERDKTTAFGDFFHHKGAVKVDSFIASMSNYFKTDVNDSNHKQSIERYRSISLMPEVDDAIEEYVQSILVHNDENADVVKIDYKDSSLFSDKLKGKIDEEFRYILNLLDFEDAGERIVRSFLIDGCFPVEKVFDSNYIGRGIIDVNFLDPAFMTKTILFEVDQYTKLRREMDTYYVFTFPYVEGQRFQATDAPYSSFRINQGYKLQIPEFLIALSDSGKYHPSRSYPLSILHKTLKVANQLKLLEDSILIYRLTRAPERRVFYIDVGNLPPAKAEEHMEEIIRQYRIEKSYNAETGALNADADIMSMIEDFWLPRRNGTATTEVSTLSGAQNLGEINDLDHFYKKLWRSLGVPYSRRMAKEGSGGMAHSHTADITADEVAFYKNIRYLRRRIEVGLFKDLLKTQLVAKEIIDADYAEEIISNIKFMWNEDNNFAELIKFEVMQTRFDIITNMGFNVSDFVSKPWVAKNILKFSDEEIEEMKIQRAHPERFGFEKTEAEATTDEGFMPSGGGFGSGGGMSPSPAGGEFGMENELEFGDEGMEDDSDTSGTFEDLGMEEEGEEGDVDLSILP